MSLRTKYEYLKNVTQNKCPRCREGDLFKTNKSYDLKNTLSMYNYCPVCHQKTEIEVGFFYGTSYVSYALSVALVATVFTAWYVLFGFSINDNSVFWCLGTSIALLIILQPPLMRFSRILWLSWFVKYDKDWRNSTSKS